MPLMPWWAPAVLGVTYLLGSLILRMIPKSVAADRPEDRQKSAAQDRQHAEHADEHQDDDEGVAGDPAWSGWLLSHGAESGRGGD